jgi:hypothetical protein
VGAVVSVELPEGIPGPDDSPEAHATWASGATRHQIVGTWRPGRTERSALVVRLASGVELFFETVAEACRPDRFITAFMAIDGVVMPSYSGPQVRLIVAALVRMAQLDREQDDRDAFADAGARFVVGCLINGGRVNVTPDAESEQARLDAYRSVLRYEIALSHLAGEDGRWAWPPVLYATDRKVFYVPRGLFLVFARRTIRGVAIEVFNAQMRRLGWVDTDLRPRKPKQPEAARPHLRMWEVPDGWDGIAADGDLTNFDLGPAVPRGPASTGAHARARGLRHTQAGPRDQNQQEDG